MNDRHVPDAVPLRPDDDERRSFAWEVMKGSNEVAVGFAKLMATTSMTAIGVLLSLAKWVELGPEDDWMLVVVGVACVGYLTAALLFAYVVRGRRIDISPDDYDDVVEQFLAAAQQRQRLTNIALGLVGVATCCGVAVLLIALA